MIIASWNVNSIKVRLPLLLDWLNKLKPDIVLLQELKCEDQYFPFEALEELNYNIVVSGQKTYNGVAILSKFPIEEINKNLIGNPCEEQARFIEITTQIPSLGYARIISVYAPNGAEVESDKFILKLKFFNALYSYLKDIKNYDELLFIGGDFNIAPEDIDVYNPNELKDTTCFTLIERQKMRAILNLPLADAYRLIHPKQQQFSWWSYRSKSFQLDHGLRIDFILCSINSTKYLTDCSIDYKLRGNEKASDHTPVIAHFKKT